MERIMKKKELIDELSARTGFYKNNMKSVCDALSDIIIEHFSTAEFDKPSELHLAPGLTLIGTRKPEGPAFDPRDHSEILSPEKVIPSVVFGASLRQKLYKKPKSWYYQKKGRKKG